MTDKQRALVAIQRRQSEARGRFNELDAKVDRTEAEGVEHRDYDGKLRGLETEFQAAAKQVEDEREATVETRTETSEGTEYRALIGRSSIGRIVAGAVEHRALDGAESEIQKHHGLAGNQIPLDLLRMSDAEARAMIPAGVEHRDVTPGPASVGVVGEPIIQPVFAMGAGMFLGISRPTVPVGDAAYNVLTSRPTAGGPHSGSNDVDDTTGAFDSELLKRERIQASFKYRRVDAGRLADYDSALRMALNDGLGEKLDFEIIAGASGLLTGTNLPNNNAAAVTTFAQYISQFIYSRVDGRFAPTAADLRAVVGSGTYTHAGSVYRANNVDDPAADIINRRTGGVQVSAHVPVVASSKQNAIIRLGMRQDMVQPLWNGVTVIVDEISGSGLGEIEVTAVLLMNTKILRKGGFYKQQTQHA